MQCIHHSSTGSAKLWNIREPNYNVWYPWLNKEAFYADNGQNEVSLSITPILTSSAKTNQNK